MEKQETFKSIQHLSLDTSFGSIKKENSVELEITVGINAEGDYGWFELYDIETGGEDWYAEGGLWFEDNTLTDYDGVFELPTPVEEKLNEWGYKTDL